MAIRWIPEQRDGRGRGPPGRLICRNMAEATAHLGDARGDWYYCFKHERVETREECHLKDRMGPYPTREDAEHWRERVAERNAEWDEGEDEE
jgi:hypothetical protein